MRPSELLDFIIADQGISQRGLARGAGLSSASISRICRGKQGLSVKTGRKIAKAYPQYRDMLTIVMLDYTYRGTL